MIKSFTLNNFTGFKENTFTFNEGVNVFIGKNGTGKTHVMKAMASILHARHDFGNKATEAKAHL